MRRSRRGDRLLLATLLPAYLLMLYAGVKAQLASGERSLPFVVLGAQGIEGHPVVIGIAPHAEGIELGDRVLRIGTLELRGLSRAEVRYRVAPLVREARPVEVGLERGGTRLQARVEPVSYPYFWWTIPVWASAAITAVFLLLRAPRWHLRRLYFAVTFLWCCCGTVFLAPVHPLMAFLGYSPVQALAAALTVWGLFSWTASLRPGPRVRAICWALGLALAVNAAMLSVLTPAAGLWNVRADALILSAFVGLSLFGLLRAYLHSGPLERRQLRWILFGFFVALLPRAFYSLMRSLAPALNLMLWDAVSQMFFVAIPMGIAISVVGYRWLDIDRLISVSATLTVLGIALLGGMFAVVPPVARATSSSLGMDPETGRFALSMALAAVVVPVYRGLQPWLDRRFFVERFKLAQRLARLRSELAGCRGVEELATCAGEGFDALFGPESIATYALAGDAYTPLFVRGRVLPPAFELRSLLVQVLEAKGAPLLARAKELGPFERAALETLGAEVIVPVFREEQLVAFTCLADKRSGDIYTASDLELLGSVAERSAEVIARLDAESVAREAQAMQSALRRYVPAAVVQRVLQGDILEPAEREVTILFVDIRGYTSLAERLSASDVFATLNEHTERVSSIVQERGGTVVEFNGDGLMAVFGAPEALADKEQQAVEAARGIVDSMPETLAVGVGVATGVAFVGNIRSSDRLIWSAVGSTTNLASRLQTLTRDLDAAIAIDATTRERAACVCACFVRHSNLAIRGREGRFDVFALPLHVSGA